MIISGLLPVDKPSGHTSFDVIARLRKILGIKKLGHTGTLDPMATGVLPVLIGRACKAQAMLECADKEYIADISFGICTDTQDITGTVIGTNPYMPTRCELERVIESFKGDIQQIPPMYSAIKSGGKRLYDLARQGVEVERKPRSIAIYELELMYVDMEKRQAKIRVKCSKGTYIRTLAEDMGKAAGSCATLSALRRTMAASFEIGQCLTLEQIESLCASGSIAEHIVPMDRLFPRYSAISLNEGQKKRFLNGARLTSEDLGELAKGDYRVYAGGEFLGTAVFKCGELRHQLLNI